MFVYYNNHIFAINLLAYGTCDNNTINTAGCTCLVEKVARVQTNFITISSHSTKVATSLVLSTGASASMLGLSCLESSVDSTISIAPKYFVFYGSGTQKYS